MSSPVTEVWQAYWDAHRDSVVAPPPPFLLESLCREVQPRDGLHVLEAGSGTGGLALELAQRGCRVTVVDIVPRCVRDVLHAAGQAGRTLQGAVADLFSLPFADGSFDVVFNSGVMEHFEPDVLQRGIHELSRVLRPGGRLIVVVPSARGRFYIAGKARLEAAGQWDYGREYPQESLAGYMQSAGLSEGHERLTGVRWQTRFLQGWRRRVASALTLPFGEHSSLGAALFGAYLLVSSWRKPAGAS